MDAGGRVMQGAITERTLGRTAKNSHRKGTRNAKSTDDDIQYNYV
jgi:hypothetical protein